MTTRKKKTTGRIGPFEFDGADLPTQISLRRKLAKLFKTLDQTKVVRLTWDDGPSSIAAQWVHSLSGEHYRWQKMSSHSAMLVEDNPDTNVCVRLDDWNLPNELGMEGLHKTANKPEQQETKGVTMQIGPWAFDTTNYPELLSNAVLSSALAEVFRTVHNDKLLLVHRDDGDCDDDEYEGNLMKWLVALSGKYYSAISVGRDALVLVATEISDWAKKKGLKLGDVIDDMSTHIDEEPHIDAPRVES